MLKKNVTTKAFILFYLTTASMMSCAPKKYTSQAKTVGQEDKQEIISQQLESTTSKYEKLSNQIADKYEAPEKTIKNKNNNQDIHVGLVKLSDIKSNYNVTTRKMEISGQVEVFSDDKKNSLGQKLFTISGGHSPKQGIFPLKPSPLFTQNVDPSEIQVRAKVTCLDFDRDDNFICTKSIIDLFIKKDKKVYTEQLQTQNVKDETLASVKAKPSSNQKADDESNKNDSKPAPSQTTAAVKDENGLQAEGESDEIKGRYVGTAATTKLDELFDEVIKSVKKKNSEEKNASIESAKDKKTTDNTPTNDTDDTDSITEFNTNFKIDQTGRVIKKNQAFGNYDGGKLRNASSLQEQMATLKLQNLYEISFPERATFYGTQEMMDIIELIGKKMTESQDKLYVSNISKQQGGRLPPSLSHQIGMDVDLGYPTPNGRVKFPVVVDRANKVFNTNAYSTKKTLEIFKYLVAQQTVPVARIFSDQNIINDLCIYAKRTHEFSGPDAKITRQVFNILSHVDGHGDHFHLRLMCTENQPACNKIIYPKTNNCQ